MTVGAPRPVSSRSCDNSNAAEINGASATWASRSCLAASASNDSIYNRNVAPLVAEKVIEVAQAEGLARRVPTLGEDPYDV